MKSYVSRITRNNKTGMGEERRYEVVTDYAVSLNVIIDGMEHTILTKHISHEPTEEEIGELILKNHATYAYVGKARYLKESDDLPF